MITYTTSDTQQDLQGILRLQRANLPEALTQEQMAREGFVTVSHSYAELEKLNAIEKHIIAKDGERIIAYLLAMTASSRFDLPVLIPMFETFDQVPFAGQTISSYKYMVVGQVCVDESYRGKGILDSCYAAYRNRFKGRYDFAITEIASTNLRSIQAHKRIGFQEIHRYIAPDTTEWSIILWDWKSGG